MNDNIRTWKNVWKLSADGKKSSLQVYYDIMKEQLFLYNNMVKDARKQYFWELIFANKHNPWLTVDQLVNPAPPCAPVESDECEIFSSYFTDKVESIKVSITPDPSYPDVLH